MVVSREIEREIHKERKKQQISRKQHRQQHRLEVFVLFCQHITTHKEKKNKIKTKIVSRELVDGVQRHMAHESYYISFQNLLKISYFYF